MYGINENYKEFIYLFFYFFSTCINVLYVLYLQLKNSIHNNRIILTIEKFYT